MLKLIEDLSNAHGAPGFEDDVLKVIEEGCPSLNFERDKMMNCYLTYKKRKEGRIKIMLDAHIDEVAFMVQFINEKGLIQFIPLGGWVPENIPAQLVVIKNRHGKYIKGVVSSKPPHFMTESERNEKIRIENLTIDVGACSREEVIEDFAISVGDPIVPFVEFEYNNENGTIMGKAFDNRLGSAAVIETMKRLKDIDLDIDLVGALACQEEVGTRGAYVTSNKVKPDLAIVFEGSPADDIFTNQYTMQCVLGHGPQIRYRDSSYISNHKFIDLARNVAERENIPYQNAVRSSGGTNAGRIHMSNEGVPVLVIGIPVRYVHTHHCYSKLEDFENTVRLACQVIKSIDQEVYDKF